MLDFAGAGRRLAKSPSGGKIKILSNYIMPRLILA